MKNCDAESVYNKVQAGWAETLWFVFDRFSKLAIVWFGKAESLTMKTRQDDQYSTGSFQITRT